LILRKGGQKWNERWKDIYGKIGNSLQNNTELTCSQHWGSNSVSVLISPTFLARLTHAWNKPQKAQHHLQIRYTCCYKSLKLQLQGIRYDKIMTLHPL
jgi:hypothetical protein